MNSKAPIGRPAGHQDRLRYLQPRPGSRFASAAVVRPGPLVYTGMVVPVSRDGKGSAAGDTAAQVIQCVETVGHLLTNTQSNLGRIVRLNVYVAEEDAVQPVLDQLAESLRTAHLITAPAVSREEPLPPVSVYVSGIPGGGVVALDAVACSEAVDTDRVRHIVAPETLSDTLRPNRPSPSPDTPGRATPPTSAPAATIMPWGTMVYLSGLASGAAGSRASDLTSATRDTMTQLMSALAYMGMSADDVVQVRVFVDQVESSGAVRSEIERWFRGGAAPSFVACEWHDSSYVPYLDPITSPIEIELHAARHDWVLRYGRTPLHDTPPPLNQPADYSRIVAFDAPSALVYTGGLSGDPGAAAAGQARGAFAELAGILAAAGCDRTNLVRGLYRITNADAAEAMNQVRRDFFGDAPPAASTKMPVSSVGLAGSVFAFDMIGFVP